MLSSAGLIPGGASAVILWAALSCMAERDGSSEHLGTLDADELEINTTLRDELEINATLRHAANQGTIPSIGDYLSRGLRVVRRLGNGAFGIVYEAKSGDRSYAVKLMQHGEKGDVRNQHHEIRMQKALEENPYAVRLELGVKASYPVKSGPLGMLVLELAEFGTLASHVTKQHFYFHRECANKYILDTYRALVFRGENLLVHADIKDENTLLFEDEDDRGQIRFKLADFGLAYWDGHRPQGNGDPVWAPPEQYPGPEGDMYCMGETAMAMFTGDRPDKFEQIRDSWSAPIHDVWFKAALSPDPTIRWKFYVNLPRILRNMHAAEFNCPVWLVDERLQRSRSSSSASWESSGSFPNDLMSQLADWWSRPWT